MQIRNAPRRGRARSSRVFGPVVRAVMSAEALEPRRLLSGGGTEDAVLIDNGGVGTGPGFQIGGRWTSTATNASVGGLGSGMTLTYSIVPDGTTLTAGSGEPNAPSDLRARLNAIYSGGQTQWLPIVQQVFSEWSAVSGITYVYEPNDDGVPMSGGNNGQLGVRGDVRIGAHVIDGTFGILAYDYFPNFSDMTLDSADLAPGAFLGSTNSLALRNVMAHEHGHGLGFNHVDPTNNTKLMEAFASTAYDGPQYDDILAVQRNYGDFYEKGSGNNVAANAVNRGTLGAGGDAIANLSLATTSDVDYFKFTTNGQFNVTINPTGTAYSQGAQGGSTSLFNGKSQMDLQVQLLASDGVTVLQTANATGVGFGETVSANAAGVYYVKVMPAPGAANNVQSYALSAAVGAPQPPGAPANVDLTAATDSGDSSTDNLTKDNTPTFTGTAAPGATISVRANGSQVGSGSADVDGNWSVTTSALSDGTYAITATATNVNGTGPASAGFNVTIDTVAPVVPTTPDLIAANDTGRFNTDNLTFVTTPSFLGTTDASARVQLVIDGANSASGSANASGAYSVAALPLANGGHAVRATAADAAGNVSTLSGTLNVTIDTVKPTVQPLVFDYLLGHTVSFAFSENVAWSLGGQSLQLDNQTTSTTLDNTTFAEGYTNASNTAAFTFTDPPTGILPDGNYQATLSGARDVAGNFMAADATGSFFVLSGDANHDRSVDLTDFTLLAANFNGTGKDYGQGNFDYDAAGTVDLTDFTILASHFNQSLPAASAVIAAAPAPLATSQAVALAPPPAAAVSESSPTAQASTTFGSRPIDGLTDPTRDEPGLIA